MPILPNSRHELFAQELANGKPASEAYELAGFKPNRHNASTLKRTQPISTRVAEILTGREHIHSQSTAKAIEAAAVTKEWILAALVANAEIALGRKTVKSKLLPRGSTSPVEVELTARDPQAANRALELLGKHLGLFIDRAEIGSAGEFEELTDDELRQELAAEIKSGVVELFGGDLSPENLEAIVRGLCAPSNGRPAGTRSH